MSHPGVSVDPTAASAEFTAVAAVLGVPAGIVGAGADPATVAALSLLGGLAIVDASFGSIAVGDQSLAGAAGQRTVGGYVTTESQNKQALTGTETVAV